MTGGRSTERQIFVLMKNGKGPIPSIHVVEHNELERHTHFSHVFMRSSLSFSTVQWVVAGYAPRNDDRAPTLRMSL